MVQVLGCSSCEDAVVVEEGHVDAMVWEVEDGDGVQEAKVPESQARTAAADLKLIINKMIGTQFSF